MGDRDNCPLPGDERDHNGIGETSDYEPSDISLWTQTRNGFSTLRQFSGSVDDSGNLVDESSAVTSPFAFVPSRRIFKLCSGRRFKG